MTQKTYQNLIDLSYELNELSEKFLKTFGKRSKEFHSSKIPKYKSLFLCFLNRARQDYISICILCDQGFGDSAAVILRALFENLVSSHYILMPDQDSERVLLAERFMDYEEIEKFKHLAYWKTHGRNQTLKANVLSKEPAIQEKYNAFRSKYSVSKPEKLPTWSGRDLRSMSISVGQEETYLSLYKLCCNFSHPSFLGAKHSTSRGQDSTTFHLRSDHGLIVMVLQSAISCFSQFLFAFDILFKLGMEHDLFAFTNKAHATFKQTKPQPKS